MRSSDTLFTALFSFGLAALSMASAHAQSYTFKDLGTFGANTNVSQGYSVNDSGQVAGYSYTSAAANAFVSAPLGGPLLDIGTLGGFTSSAGGINNAGMVTGGASLPGDAVTHAFLYTPGSALKDLGTLDGANSAGAAINSSGQVAGYSQVIFLGTTVVHGFLSGADGGPLKSLGTLGGENSDARAVNNAGRVTGTSELYLRDNNDLHAYLSAPDGGPLQDLGTLGGSSSGGNAVNDRSQVAGYSELAGNSAFHAFLSGTNGGPLQDLGTLGGDFSDAYGINNSGQVVGFSYTGQTNMFNQPVQHAFLYTGGRMLDLNNLIAPDSGFTLVSATSISSSGYITGYADDANGEHAFLLTPEAVPEASTSLGFGLLLGLGGVFTAARRKAKALP